jgi:uncharacterized membrane protein YedE/YeeE
MKRALVAFLSGVVFSAGLLLSGMTQPSKVLAFLDVSGAWDPSLALVMASAVAVSAAAFRASARLQSPRFDRRFLVPPRQGAIGVRLLAGAAIFGVGWGLSGLCPGPALVSLAAGNPGLIGFVAAMFCGMAIQGWASRPGGQPDSDVQRPVSSV